MKQKKYVFWKDLVLFWFFSPKIVLFRPFWSYLYALGGKNSSFLNGLAVKRRTFFAASLNFGGGGQNLEEISQNWVFNVICSHLRFNNLTTSSSIRRARLERLPTSPSVLLYAFSFSSSFNVTYIQSNWFNFNCRLIYKYCLWIKFLYSWSLFFTQREGTD